MDRDAVELNQDAIDETHALTGSTACGPAWIAKAIQHNTSMRTTGSRIEEGFRVLKHTMATRPIYHWTPSRGPTICFVAFALLRLLRYQHNTWPLSEARLSGAGYAEGICSHPPPPAQRTLYSVAGLKYPSRTRELATPDQLP